MKEILILGGTGAMGRHLINILLSQGHLCTVTSRSPHTDAEGLHYVQGNARSSQFLQTILSEKEWDAIVDFMSYGTFEFEQKVGRLLAATKQYIFLSSSRVYAASTQRHVETDPLLIDECTDEKYLRSDEYALAKTRQERMLHQSANSNWTIIRPYITFSENRLQLGQFEKEYWLYRALHHRKVVFPRELLDIRTTLTYGQDVAQGIAAIIGHASALGKTFHITSSESITWREVIDVYQSTFKQSLGKELNFYYTERWDSRLGGVWAQVQYDRLYNRTFDNAEIGHYMDRAQMHPVKEALAQSLTAFLKHPDFGPIDMNSETYKDLLTGDWSTLWEISGLRDKIKYLLTRLRVINL